MENRLLPLKQTISHPFDPPLPLHVDVVWAVHHHFGDVRIPQQELDRTSSDDRVRDLIDHLRERALREDVTVLPQDRECLLSDKEASFRARDAVEVAHVDPSQQALVQVPPDIPERVDGAHEAAPSSATVPRLELSVSRRASPSIDRPKRPRIGKSRPRSCAAGAARSAGMTASAGVPNTRSTSFGEISERRARLTTNAHRSSSPAAAIARFASRNERTSRPS